MSDTRVVSGIGTLLGKITYIPPSEWIWGLNIIFMILGFVLLGKQNGIKSVYCSMLYPAIEFEY